MNKAEINGDFEISDGYHTMAELYEHRVALWIALCRSLENLSPGITWRSCYHSDGSRYEGWFLLGYRREAGQQITYHVPESQWGATYFAQLVDRPPDFDGHSSVDVLARLAAMGNDWAAPISGPLRASAHELYLALKEMAEYYGPDHEQKCPGDDTCNCKLKPFNDRVNNALKKAEGK